MNGGFCRWRVAVPALVALMAGASSSAQPASTSSGQAYPVKPVRLVLGTAPGGGFDITARIIATPLSELLGQQVVIDNRPGAGGGIAATLVANAPADGYTLIMGTVSSHGINPALYRKLPYDHIKDFAPVSMVATVPNVLAVHPSVPANNVGEFISYAKANPGKVLYGSAGIGSSLHLSMELLKSLAGINIVHVPYKGSALFMPDLLSGQILAICSNIPSLLPYIGAKRIRPLAVTSAKPTPRLPGLPTLMESGVPMEVIVWYAIFAPAATPQPVLARLHADLGKVLNNPEVRKRLDEQGVDARPSTAGELAAFVRAETARWQHAVKVSGATAN
jgi:tripartite-type tricarboxylate transporter receptor subunit TctC